MNGRRYSVSPVRVGTHRSSAATSSRSEARNSSSGSSGMASRWAESRKRAALASGRNAAIDPSGWRYALRPSKIACP